MYSVVRFFWPSLSDDDIKKFGILSITFFFVIGGYWMTRLLKDTIFFKIAFPEALGWAPGQGGLYQPIAKIISVFVVVFMILIYSKLVDMFEKHKLFYIVAGFYATIFSTITTLLIFRSLYGDAALGKTVLALIGWVSYFSIESYGSIMVPLFWSFTISVTDSESAKVGFPFVLAGAQIGAVGGSGLTIFASSFGSIWPLFMIGTMSTLMVIVMISIFMAVVPHQGSEPAKIEKKDQGFVESFLGGLRLLVTRPYILGILVVSTIYEIIGTIVDYQMKRQAAVFPAYASEVGYAKFLGIFGVASNGLALLFALLGTSYMMKRLGLRFCLMVFPVCTAVALGSLYIFFNQGPTPEQLLWTTFVVMMIIKGVSYAVNNPTKEMMYIPTSKDVKFKAKGWVDMFGGRTAKMGGSQVTNALKHSMNDLMLYGTLFGFGLIAVWILAALFVGKKNSDLLREGKIIQ